MQVDVEADADAGADAADVEFSDVQVADVRVTGVKSAAAQVVVADGEAAGVLNVESDSDSSGSSSASSVGRRSRSRSRQRNKQVGAVAATALLTAQEPLDLEEAERIVEHVLTMPTSFAARLQNEGGAVAIMVEMGVTIDISPQEADPNQSVLRISGTAHAVGRATSEVQLLYDSDAKEARRAKDAVQTMAQVEVPGEEVNVVLGRNSALVAELRARCGGVMIALQPSERPGGPLTVFIGPGPACQVAKAEKELRESLLDAEVEAAAADEDAEEAAAEGEAGRPTEAPGAAASGSELEAQAADAADPPTGAAVAAGVASVAEASVAA